MVRFERAVGSDCNSFAKKSAQTAIFLFVMILAMTLNVTAHEHGPHCSHPHHPHPHPTESNSSNEKQKIGEILEAVTNLRKETTQNTASTFEKIGKNLNSIGNLEQIFKASFANLELKLSSEYLSKCHLLFDQFTNQSNVLSDKIAHVEISQNNLAYKMENIEKLLQQLENEKLIKGKENEKRRLTDECIKEIETYRFDKAEKKLFGIDDVSEIFYIVRKVYNNQVNNFNILMKFAETIQSVGRRFVLYKALYNELKDNDHHDYIKLLRLIRGLHEKIILAIDSSGNEGKMKEEVESLISTIAKDFINLLSEKEINKNSVVELAFGIKALLGYECLNSDLKQQVETFKAKLPISVKNMAFLSKACFLAVEFKSSFYVGEEQNDHYTLPPNSPRISIVEEPKNHNFDREARLIESRPCKNDWTFEHISHNVVRINNHVVNETFYISNNEKAGDYNNLPLLIAKVRGNHPGKVISEDEKWIVEPIGNDIRLKNVANNRYLISFRPIENNYYKLCEVYAISPRE